MVLKQSSDSTAGDVLTGPFPSLVITIPHQWCQVVWTNSEYLPEKAKIQSKNTFRVKQNNLLENKLII